MFSPLTYPGGKYNQAEAIAAAIPLDKDYGAEYREPFIGGGSVALLISARRPDAYVWVNDLNPDVANFWQQLKVNGESLAYGAEKLLPLAQNAPALAREIERLRSSDAPTLQAIGWFVLNRCTYGGLGDFGGVSPNRGRFTASSIAKLRAAIPLLKRWQITNLDYAQLLNYPGRKVSIFCDPPYRQVQQAKRELYIDHQQFDWPRFRRSLDLCKHNVLATLDDCPENRQLFGPGYHVTGCTKFYGLSKSRKPEIWVSNYRRAEQLTLV